MTQKSLQEGETTNTSNSTKKQYKTSFRRIMVAKKINILDTADKLGRKKKATTTTKTSLHKS